MRVRAPRSGAGVMGAREAGAGEGFFVVGADEEGAASASPDVVGLFVGWTSGAFCSGGSGRGVRCGNGMSWGVLCCGAAG